MKTLLTILITIILIDNCLSQTPGTWNFAGPFDNVLTFGGTTSSSHGAGRICCIALHPTNSNLLYLSSPRGSMYIRDESENSSSLINSEFPSMLTRSGIATIAIDPNNSNNILIGTGDNQGPFAEWEKRTSSTGIYLSTDGGSTFNPTSLSKDLGDTRFNINKDNWMRVSKIIFDPNNPDVAYAILRWLPGGDVAWATPGGEIYKSTDGGLNWSIFSMTGITNPDKYFWDMEIQHGGSFGKTILYVSSRKIYKYTEEFNLWEDKTSKLLTLQSDPNSRTGRILLTVTPNNSPSAYDNYIGALVMIANPSLYPTPPINYLDLYISQDGFATNVNKEVGEFSAIDIKNLASGFRLSFAVNADFSRIYFGSVKLYYSIDGGFTASQIYPIHDDIMDIQFPAYTGTNLNTIYVGCDGGFYVSTNGTSFIQSNNGLGGVAELFDIDYATNYHRLVTGAQDCASFMFDQTGWQALLQGGDGSSCLFNREDEEIFYTSDYQNDCDDVTPCYGDVFYNTASGTVDDEMSNDEGVARRSGISTMVMASDPSDPNSIYLGFEVLKKSNPLTLDFTDLSSPPLHTSQVTNAIRAIEVSKSDPNIIFIACEGVWVLSDGSGTLSTDYAQENISAYKDYELFVHFNSGIDDLTPNHGWVNISPKQNGVYSWITSIAVCDEDPNKIWITYDAFRKNGSPPTDNCNVYKGVVGSPPLYTTTWTAFSEHLPKTPTNKIIYQNGTNDRLFVCTDSGDDVYNGSVYYRDATMSEWEIFSDKLSHSMIFDIEIDYCRQILGAATFGGGVWETDLPYTSTEDIVISSDITWSTDEYIYSNVTIEAGATLTITSGATINMAGDRKITVKRGASLIVNNATLTNTCNALWGGIEVWGYNTLDHPSITSILSGSYPLTGSDHGVVLIKGNSVIENSRNAISTSKYNESGWSDPEYHGGIIVALGSTFKNNKRSAEFLSFGKENISEFIACTFITDDDLNEGSSPNAHVTMWAVKGVLFMSNTFENNLPYGPKQGITRGKGIYSEEATYDVLRVCITPVEPCGCSEWEGNTFKGLYRGIEARSIGVDFIYPLTIDGNNFINNERGALISSIGNIEMINNNFEVPDFIKTICYGAYLEGAMNYHVENNYFNTFGTVTVDTDPNSGLFVANNSSVGTTVYRNYFSDMEIGFRSQNNNGGLQIRCNDFSQVLNKYNIVVSSGNLAHQGSCIIHTASNLFSHDCLISDADFKLQSGVPGINYYYSADAPTCYSTGINLIPCTGIYLCASQIENPCEGSGGEAQMMLESSNELQTIIDANYQKIDGGNTEKLLSDIETGIVTKSRLDEIGPYLSDDVLEKLIQTPTELSIQELIDVLSDNSPLSDIVSVILESAEFADSSILNQLTTTILDTGEGIEAFKISPMQQLIYDIDFLENEKDILLENATDIYLLESKIDSAIILLVNVKANWAKQKLIGLYLNSEEYISASMVLDSMITSDPEINSYKEYIHTIINIKSDGRDFSEIFTDEESTFRNLNSKQSSIGIAAGNILRFAFKEDYTEIIDSIYDEPEMKYVNQNTKSGNPEFNLYPNPTSQLVYIELINVDLKCNNFLSIYDITGKLIKRQKLESNLATSWISLANLNPGIYIFEVSCNNNQIGVQKLIIE